MAARPQETGWGEALGERDWKLVSAAQETIHSRYRPGWHVVGAALRLRDGQVVTGVHLEAEVGRIAVCAEAVALGRAVTEWGSSAVETMVAVQHPGGEVAVELIPVVSPCGMCREMLSDYSPEARVIVRGADGLRCVPVGELLPWKYRASVQPEG